MSHRAVLPPTIALCGSRCFFGHMLELQKSLARRGVASSLPLLYEEGDDPAQHARRWVERIRSPETRALLVVNLEKYGVPDYVGPHVLAEVGLATAEHKPVYLLGGIPAFCRDEFTAWGVTPLEGAVTTLIGEFISRHLPSEAPCIS